MTADERAEFDAAQRDADLWRYFQSEDQRLATGAPADPHLKICARALSGALYPVPVEKARKAIEEFYRKAIPVS